MSKNTASIKRKTWEEFESCKLLWWVNRSLHLLGWCIVLEYNNEGRLLDAYPARTKFRGFDSKVEEVGFAELTRHLSKNINELEEESNE